jgi:hypothetical protein
MVNNKGYELREGYGNAAKMSKTFTNDGKDSDCEVQILLCQMSDKDQDAFIVSVAGKGEQAMHHAFRELNVLRSFIYADSWGLNFHEFCLPLWHVDDQKRLSRVREDFLDEKKALDEVEPYIFGVPQMVERDSFDRAEASASSVHEDCMAVRREWSRWYFGDKPDMEEVLRWKGLSNDEKFQEGILRLRRGAQYEPTTVALNAGNFKTAIQEADVFATHIYEAALHLELSDIYQLYAASCYDDDIKKLANEPSMRSRNIAKVITSTSVGSLERHTRETLYRSEKILCTVASLDTKTKEAEAKTLNSFDGSISASLDLSCTTPEMVRNEGEDVSVHFVREAIIQDARKLLFGQHENIYIRNHRDPALTSK